MTDREVELLLQKNYRPSYSHHFSAGCFGQDFSTWPSEELKPTNQEPFVALDQNSSSSNEMSTSDEQNLGFDSVFNGACNEANNLENKEVLHLLKDINFEDAQGSKNISTPQKQTEVDDVLNQELEEWLQGFQHSNKNLSNTSLDLEHNNEEKFLCLSPNKTLIPSIRSAFSEVSPSKVNKLKSNTDADTNCPSKSLLPNVIANDTSFLSPASSGFSEENSGGEDNSSCFNKFSLFNSKVPFPHPQANSEIKKLSFEAESSLLIKSENVEAEHQNRETSDSFFQEINLDDRFKEVTLKGTHLTTTSTYHLKDCKEINNQSQDDFLLSISDSVNNVTSFPTTSNDIPVHSANFDATESTKLIENDDSTKHEDSQLIETINMLESLKNCSRTPEKSLSLLNNSNKSSKNTESLSSHDTNSKSNQIENLFEDLLTQKHFRHKISDVENGKNFSGKIDTDNNFFTPLSAPNTSSLQRVNENLFGPSLNTSISVESSFEGSLLEKELNSPSKLAISLIEKTSDNITKKLDVLNEDNTNTTQITQKCIKEEKQELNSLDALNQNQEKLNYNNFDDFFYRKTSTPAVLHNFKIEPTNNDQHLHDNDELDKVTLSKTLDSIYATDENINKNSFEALLSFPNTEHYTLQCDTKNFHTKNLLEKIEDECSKISLDPLHPINEISRSCESDQNVDCVPIVQKDRHKSPSLENDIVSKTTSSFIDEGSRCSPVQIKIESLPNSENKIISETSYLKS